MIPVVIIISMAAFSNALNPAGTVELADDNTRSIINKYISNIPDITDQFIIDERLSKAISHYFKGKLSSFPLYRISLKIDRNPVKIPWTIEAPKQDAKGKLRDRVNNQLYHPSPEPYKPVQKKYKYEKHFTIKNDDIDSTETSEKRTVENITKLSKEHKNINSAKLLKKPVKVKKLKRPAKKKEDFSNTAKSIPNTSTEVKTNENKEVVINDTASITIDKPNKSVEMTTDFLADHNSDIQPTQSTTLAKFIEETIDKIPEVSPRASELAEHAQSEDLNTTISPELTEAKSYEDAREDSRRTF